MIGKLLPLLLLLVGLGAGVGAGIALRPEPEPPQEQAAADDMEGADEKSTEPAQEEEAAGREYLKMNNQFVVPVVGSESVDALVVLSLSLEVAAGRKSDIYEVEPKLRDSFLQVLFDHANTGGFSGAFTDVDNITILRAALLEAAQRDMKDAISDVLIQDIARQDY